MKPKSFLFPLLIVIALAIFYLALQKFSQCNRLACIQMDNLKNYQLENIYTDNDKLFQANYQTNNQTLKVEIRSKMTTDQNIQYTNSAVAKIKGLYSDSAAPYPGVISDEVVCNPEYKPSFKTLKSKSGNEISYFTGYFNSQDVFPACAKDQISKAGIFAVFYCEGTKQTFTLSMFEPNTNQPFDFSKYEQMLNSVSCSKS